jgi:hypothetical protein
MRRRRLRGAARWLQAPQRSGWASRFLVGFSYLNSQALLMVGRGRDRGEVVLMRLL